MHGRDSAFVDTNALVYAHDVDAGPKYSIARGVIAGLWETRTGAVCVQVLWEFYVTMTRKLFRPLSPKAARQIVRDYPA